MIHIILSTKVGGELERKSINHDDQINETVEALLSRVDLCVGDIISIVRDED